MHVAINALQVRAAKSGVGQYIQGLVEGLSRVAPSDDEFTILCTRENRANYDLGSAARNFRAVTWGLPQRARAARLLYEYSFLPQKVKHLGSDVLHGASNFLPPYRVKGVRYVVTIHDLSYYVDPSRCPPLRRRYWYTMTARTVAMADRIVTDSENSRRDIERFFPQARVVRERKISVVPLAAHPRFSPADNLIRSERLKELQLPGPERFNRPMSIEPPPSSAVLRLGDDPYLLYVGTLEPGKNAHTAIKAFDRIASDFPEHRLLLAGDMGWLATSILEAALSARASDRIHWLGHTADSLVVELMQHCDVFVYPSLYEGFGLPPLEAMACGAPVITSNVSSIPEVVGDAAIQIVPKDEPALAEAIRAVLSDTTLRSRLRAKGLAQAASFSWDRTARETLAVYSGD